MAVRRAAVTAAVAALAAAVMAGALVALARPEPGIYLDIRLLSPSGAEETGWLRGQNVLLCIAARLLTPGDPIPHFGDCLRGVPVVKIPYGAVKPYIDMWAAHLRATNASEGAIREHVTGMIVDVILVNKTGRRPLYAAHGSIPIRLGDFERPRVVYYTVYARRGVPGVEVSKALDPPVLAAGEVVTAAKVEAAAAAGEIDCPCITDCMCAKYILVTTPDNMTAYLPGDYFEVVSGARYVKTPTAIVYDKYSYSGLVGGYFKLALTQEQLRIREVYAVGDLVSKLLAGIKPGVNLQIGGATWGGTQYSFATVFNVAPEGITWVYIMARPVFRLYKVYLCSLPCSTDECLEYSCSWVHDVADAYVENVLASGNNIKGGFAYGWPHSSLTNYIFQGSQLSGPLCISGTPLDDCKLDPGETIEYKYVFQTFDTCSDGFEVEVPVGAWLAAAIAARANPVAAAFAAAFIASLDYAPASVYVKGALTNIGQFSGIGYNTYEQIYVAVSNYVYAYGSCKYSVPVGVYFESR
jgi:hypothetical protein